MLIPTCFETYWSNIRPQNK